MFDFVARILRIKANKAVERRILVQVVPRDPCRVSLLEWRTNPDLLRIATKFLRDPEFRMMLDVLDRENPASMSFTMSARASLKDRAVQQAKCEGYVMAIANLESMGTPWEPPQAPPEATFEPEETPQETE